MIIVTTHQNADFDCVASMAAALKLYPDAFVFFPGAQEKNVRDFLAHADYHLPILRHKNLDLKQVKVVVMVDAAGRVKLGPLDELAERDDVEFHIYDHHPFSKPDLPNMRPTILERGSTTTIMVEILRKRGISVTPMEATLLMLGIYEDTGSLSFPSTRFEDYEAAGWLLKQGADLNMVSDYMRRELTAEQVDTLNNLLKNLEARRIGGQAVAVAAASVERHIGDIAALAHKIMDIESVNSLFILVQMEGRIHLVARSRVKEINAGAVAGYLGGGGHPTAASATIKDLTIHQAAEKVWEAVRDAMAQANFASDMMVERVITVKSGDSIEEAGKLMTRYDINGMPVMDHKRVAGLITRQIVEKAIHHGMASHPVEELMITEFATVHPDTPAHVVEDIMLGSRQKQAPVVDRESGALVGLLCRGQVLGRLYGEAVSNRVYATGVARAQPAMRDVSGLLRDRMPAPLARLLNVIADVANKNNYVAYLAGGCVRDLLLRIPNMDMDVVVEGDGADFAKKLAARLLGRARIHEKFKTAVVVTSDGLKIDVATARLEYYTHPAALPIVEMSAIRNDLYRRDFSINAMAIRLNGARPNMLLDFFGGQADLKDRVIRVLHNLSFVEDPTRAFRAVRFESRFGFSIGRQTLTLLKNAVRHELFNRLSGARLFSEIKAILNERRPVGAARRMKELGLLRFIHPSLTLTPESERVFDNVEDLLTWMALAFPRRPVRPWFARLLALLDGLEENHIMEMVTSFRPAAKVLKESMECRRFAKLAFDEPDLWKEPPPSTLHRIFGEQKEEALLYFAAKSKDSRVTNAVTRYIGEISGIKPLLNGEDIMAMGVAPSRRLGEALRDIYGAQLDGRLSSREDAVRMAKEILGLG
ncbi:MAG: CBS domain-containing protein [Nitrospinae bacterium]|nr:CBS domain-containing protein [Nitrospinota bacterium]